MDDSLKLPKVQDNAPAATSNRKVDTRKFGLVLLSGVVVGSMIGGGAFNLPQNMASGAGLGAVAIAWLVTLAGMFFLSNTFRTLADERPDLSAGIYRYAQDGFGRLAGFEMAWGYWLSSAFGNVAFAVLITQILGYFFPIFGNGQNWPSLIAGSVLIWVMHFAVLSGVKRAASMSVFASAVNMVTIGMALIIMAAFITQGHFSFDIWGQQQQLGSVLSQVKSTMLVTLWVFIGIEAAVVVSDRARKPQQVGLATFIGLAVCTTLYFLLSALPFGLLAQKDIAGLSSPSTAYILQTLVGNWGALFVNVALLFSVLFCWLSWTILVAELPFEGAKGGVFPKFLARENSHHAAAPSLWISSLVMQVTMFIVLFAHDAWIWLISITGVMILPPYLASTLYLCLLSRRSSFKEQGTETRDLSLLTGILGTLYAGWLLYAAGLQYLLLSSIAFAVGIPVYWYAHRERASKDAAFSPYEVAGAALLVVVAIGSLVLFSLGIVKIG